MAHPSFSIGIISALTFGIPLVGNASEFCATQVAPDICPAAARDVASFTPNDPSFIGSSVLCAHAVIDAVPPDAPPFNAAGHCYEEYDGTAPVLNVITIPLVTASAPGQFGSAFIESQTSGIVATSASVELRSQSSITQGPEFAGTTSSYEGRASFGGNFVIQNTGTTEAIVTVDYRGLASTTVSGGGSVTVSFNARLFDTTSGSASQITTQSGALIHSSSSSSAFGLFGGGNVSCALGTCTIDADSQLGGSIVVSPESTAMIAAIVDIRTQGAAADEGSYQATATDTHTFTVSTMNQDVAISLLPEPRGAAAYLVSATVLTLLARRKRGLTGN